MPEFSGNKIYKSISITRHRILLRELRTIWKYADPEPTAVEVSAAKNLGILTSNGDALEKLKEFWSKNAIEGYSLRHFEAALVRLGLEMRRKKRGT